MKAKYFIGAVLALILLLVSLAYMPVLFKNHMAQYALTREEMFPFVYACVLYTLALIGAVVGLTLKAFIDE